MNNSIKTIIGAVSLLLISVTLPQAADSDCPAYFPMNEGAFFELTNYNAKGKIAGRTEHEVISKSEDGGNLTVVVASKVYDKKDEELTNLEYEVRCSSGVFEFQIHGFDIEQMAGADINAKVEGDFLDIPADPKAGQKLKDGELTLTLNDAMKMTTTITNRQVDAVEEITTPAGKFEYFKITYDVATKFVIGVKGKAAEWYARDVGLVRSETYNKKGKLQGYSELTKFSNNH